MNISNMSLRYKALNERDMVIIRTSEVERNIVNSARVLDKLAEKVKEVHCLRSLNRKKTIRAITINAGENLQSRITYWWVPVGCEKIRP